MMQKKTWKNKGLKEGKKIYAFLKNIKYKKNTKKTALQTVITLGLIYTSLSSCVFDQILHFFAFLKNKKYKGYLKKITLAGEGTRTPKK